MKSKVSFHAVRILVNQHICLELENIYHACVFYVFADTEWLSVFQ